MLRGTDIAAGQALPVAAGERCELGDGLSGTAFMVDWQGDGGSYKSTETDFFARLAEVSGSPAPRLRLARGLYTAGALLTEEIARQLGREPAVDRISREMAACYWYFSSERATRELGHDPRDGRVTLLETVHWFRGRDAS